MTEETASTYVVSAIEGVDPEAVGVPRFGIHAVGDGWVGPDIAWAGHRHEAALIAAALNADRAAFREDIPAMAAAALQSRAASAVERVADGHDHDDRRRHTRCSFCGKHQDQVRKLVAGPGVYICEDCIDLCREVIDADSRKAADAHGGPGSPDPSPQP